MKFKLIIKISLFFLMIFNIQCGYCSELKTNKKENTASYSINSDNPRLLKNQVKKGLNFNLSRVKALQEIIKPAKLKKRPQVSYRSSHYVQAEPLFKGLRLEIEEEVDYVLMPLDGSPVKKESIKPPQSLKE